MRKIAILGTAPNSRLFAPFDDVEWDIWVCSPGNRGGIMKRVTRWYELHGIVDIKGPENNDWNKDYFSWLNEQTFPVYMQEPNDLCPQARVFPMRSWLKEFGARGRINATSSISWMIGHAIMEGADVIGIWGVDMADATEAYSNQKSGCLNMLQIAHERGIKVEIPLESCLGTMPPLYGYAEASRMGRRLLVRKMTLQNEIKNAENEFNRWRDNLHTLRGMAENLDYIMRTFIDGEHDCVIDVEETEMEIEGRKAVAVTSAGTTVTRSTVTRVPNGLSPDKMEVEKVGSLFVPKGHGDERRAEE